MGISLIHNFDERSCINDLYKSIFNINHTGQEHCGIISLHDGEFSRKTKKGLVRELNMSENMKGNRGIGNVSKINDHQPLIFYPASRLPPFALTFDGFIVNRNELKEDMRAYLSPFDAELAGGIISEGKDFPDGIRRLSGEIKGYFCLGILTKDGESYLARSPLGTKELLLGQGKKGYASITESRAFRKIGIKSARGLKPGEILKINEYVLTPLGMLKGNYGMKLCSFLHGYYSWIDSVVEVVPVSAVRERVMAKIVEKDKEKGLKADIATSIEDSGKAYGEGYALCFGIPYLSTLIKYPYWVRSYDRPKGKRSEEALGKVSSVDARLKDRVVVICEDSIRRGTVLGEGPIKYAKNAGAKEIHLRVGTPRNTYYCRLDKQDASDDSLLANRCKTDEEIADLLGVDSVRFPTVDEYASTIEECAKIYGSELRRKDLCLGCYTGNFDFLD